MKWIGQHIYDLTSRFRDDVYFEDLENGASDTDKFLIVGASGKLKYRTGAQVLSDIDGGSGDITSIVAGTGLSGTGLTGPIPTLNVDASQTQITSVGTIGTGAWQGTAIATAYIADDAVTEDKLADTLLAEIDANTAKVTNSDQSKADINALDITELGTISSGVWQGTTVASAYLDADTAHLSGAQTFTGTKTLNSFKGTGGATVTNILDEDAMGSDSATALATQQSIKAYANRPDSQIVMMRAGFKGDVTTTKYYVPLQAELEQTTYNHETNGFLAPFSGKLLKVMYRASGNLSGSSNSVTFRLEQIPRNVGWTTPTVLETIAVDGPTNNTTDPNMVTADFVGGSGTNSFVAGDMIMVSMQHSADVAGGSTRHFFTLIFETDYTSLA